ncbi:UV-endonuclease UvdE [Mucor ambiguus]|uniref:UV-endonuclease UvdE n=1 Tax=Mucor ambiguus TaxID=91626 RepID=A0A0C9N263_9FUNG|nr:UV-endonuclease UvdE [Mucor ambiguus]
MGKKAAITAVKLESTVAATTFVEPKNEETKNEAKVIVKLEEEDLTETAAVIETPRYVHENPRAFKGRLGYACMNTILRKQKPSVFSARTCRLATVAEKGIEVVKEIALQNVADMKTMIQWNEGKYGTDHNVRFMRLSSDMFPFASHEKIGYEIDFAAKELKEAGDLANKYKHRLTMHPGQYNQLVSLNPKVVANTTRELYYHAHMLDLMGMDQDSVMIIHMGGVYGDRESALARFELEYQKLPDTVKRRLVLENDELGYSVSDLLPICQKLQVPLVLDWHHHHINPGNVTDLLSLLPAINKTWTDKGIKPKQHYSESRNGAVTQMERRAHSDRVQNLPPTTDDVDLMIEAKDKEQAVFHLYKLFDLETVDDDVWIPQTGIETKQTNGRKSNKAIRKKAAEDALKEELKDENGDDDYSEDVKPKRVRKATTNKKATSSAKKRKADMGSDDQDEVKVEEEVTQVRQTTKRATAAALAKRKKIEEQVEAIEMAMEEKENESAQADPDVSANTAVPEKMTKRKKPTANGKATAVDLPVKAPPEVKVATRRSRRNGKQAKAE